MEAIRARRGEWLVHLYDTGQGLRLELHIEPAPLVEVDHMECHISVSGEKLRKLERDYTYDPSIPVVDES